MKICIYYASMQGKVPLSVGLDTALAPEVDLIHRVRLALALRDAASLLSCAFLTVGTEMVKSIVIYAFR